MYTTQRPDVGRQFLWRIGAFLCKVSVHFTSHTHSERICATGNENAYGNMNIYFFIYDLFSSDYTAPNDEMMNNELERMGKEMVVS
jgi:hypothetical protein